MAQHEYGRNLPHRDPVEKSVVNSTFFSFGLVGVIRSGAAIIHLVKNGTSARWRKQ
ncbi:MAG: hypothetical protein ACRD72_01435 [Candidatus Angelobacter sp.]|jgi:hypothetical protein